LGCGLALQGSAGTSRFRGQFHHRGIGVESKSRLGGGLIIERRPVGQPGRLGEGEEFYPRPLSARGLAHIDDREQLDRHHCPTMLPSSRVAARGLLATRRLGSESDTVVVTGTSEPFYLFVVVTLATGKSMLPVPPPTSTLM